VPNYFGAGAISTRRFSALPFAVALSATGWVAAQFQSGNVAVLRGLRLATGYTGLVASSVLDPDDPTTQRIAGVEWREAGYAWTRTPDHMARARLVSTAQPSADNTTVDPRRTTNENPARRATSAPHSTWATG